MELKAVTEVGVAATRRSLFFIWLLVLTFCLPLTAAILPEDRADFSYFNYSGGGVDVDIPGISVRKQIGDKFSVSGLHYVDSITSASIDVVTGASEYTEERTETGVGIDYLSGKNIYSLGYSVSEENDYEATTMNFGVAHSVFGDLTTVSLGYSRGNDSVFRTIKNPDGSKERDSGFEEDVTRQNYQFGVSQILTKDWIVDLTFETITDEGYLNNPYRSIRYADATSGYLKHGEKYPDTRTSHAVALRSKYFLPYRASIFTEYRYFQDTWGITAHQAGLGYTHTLNNKWIFDINYRYYTQSSADFYSDLFPAADSHEHMARDKELSTYTDHTIGFGVTYEFTPKQFSFIKKGSVNLKYDYLMFDYENFRDLRDKSSAAGEEELYNFSASMIHLYLSIWY